MNDHKVGVPAPSDQPKNEMIILDPNHPRSIINLVPVAVANAIQRLPTEWVECSEEELKALFQERKVKMTALEDRIRFMFWKEYDNAQSNMRQMIMTHVYSGVCSRDYFYAMLQHKEKVAWLLCPPVDYMIGAEEALTFGLEQLRDILARPHVGIMGVVDAKAAAIKLEIVKMLDLRVKGAIVQTTRNLNVNMNANKPVVAVAPKIEDVDNRIKELEKQLKELNEGKTSSTLDTIEVTGESS